MEEDAALDRLRTICLRLPEAVEKETWEAPTFRVRDKIFAMVHPRDGAPSLMTPLIFDSRITRSMQAATLLDNAFCIRLGYVTRGVTRSAGPASRCRWQDDLGSEPTTLESQKKK